MNKEKLLEKLRKLQDAYDKLFENVLNSATDEDLQKLNNIEKMVEETKAQIEKLEDKPEKIPGSPVKLTESQKFIKRLVEAVSTSGNFAGALPREMADSVTELVNQYANLRQYCTVYTVGGEYAITVEVEPCPRTTPSSQRPSQDSPLPTSSPQRGAQPQSCGAQPDGQHIIS